VERRFILTNQHGIHARAATRFVQVTSEFRCNVDVEKDGECQSGKSVVGMLMLLAGKGDSITVRCSGEDAAAALEAIDRLITENFGENG